MIIAKRLWILALVTACSSSKSDPPHGSGAGPATHDPSPAPGADGRPGWITDELIAAVERPIAVTSDLGQRLEEAGADCRRATAAVLAAVAQYAKVRTDLDQVSRALDYDKKPARDKAWLSRKLSAMKRHEIDKARFRVYAVACKDDHEHRAALARLPQEARLVLAAATTFEPPGSVITIEMRTSLGKISIHMSKLAGELAGITDCTKAAAAIRTSADAEATKLAEAIKPLRAANEDVRTWFVLNFNSLGTTVPVALQDKCKKDPAFRAAFDAHPLK